MKTQDQILEAQPDADGRAEQRGGGVRRPSDAESVGDSAISAISSIDDYIAEAMALDDEEQTGSDKNVVEPEGQAADEQMEEDMLKAIQNSIEDQQMKKDEPEAHHSDTAESSKTTKENNEMLKENYQDSMA